MFPRSLIPVFSIFNVDDSAMPEFDKVEKFVGAKIVSPLFTDHV